MKVLVVVDMQNDFITGSLGTPEAQAILPNVKKKINEYVANENLILFTQDTHYANYLNTPEGKKLPVEHCIQDTWGWQIADELIPNDYYGEVILKHTFGRNDLGDVINYFLHGLSEELNKNTDIESIEIIGLCTDICVVSNALILKADYYDTCEISVDATCCAGVTPETHECALKTMEMCQIDVKRG